MSARNSDRVHTLIAGYHREVLHRRLFTLACRLGSVCLAGLYVYLLIGLGRADAFYITLSLAAIVHGPSASVAARLRVM